MSEAPRRIYVCFGETVEHLEELQRCAKHGAHQGDWWTVNKNASEHDGVVFYMMAPLSSFVATGTIAQKPRPVTSGEFIGKYRASMANIAMLSRPVHLHEAKAKFPDWSYLRALHNGSQPVPVALEDQFLELLGTG